MDEKDSFTFRHIDIKQELLDSLKQKFRENLPQLENFFIPMHLDIKEFMGMEIGHSVLIYAKPLSRSTLHVDYRADNLKLALNIALENCKYSLTEMWQCEGEPVCLKTPTGIPYNNYEKKQCKKICDFTLSRPVIFNTKVPHSVWNFSNKPRLAISLRFKQDPWHLVGL